MIDNTIPLPEEGEITVDTVEGVPVPDMSYLEQLPETNEVSSTMSKHAKTFEIFCKWASLPKNEREPRTEVAFAMKYGLPKNYTIEFKKRKEFQQKRLFYFWDWMMDKFPDIVMAVYKRAMKKSTTDARIFADIMAKKLSYEKTPSQITNFMLVGVSQDKLNKLFTPKSLDKVLDNAPDRTDQETG